MSFGGAQSPLCLDNLLDVNQWPFNGQGLVISRIGGERLSRLAMAASDERLSCPVNISAESVGLKSDTRQIIFYNSPLSS